MLTLAQAIKIYPGDYTELQLLTGGHIHKTYRVKRSDGKSLIFQQFNSSVFKRKDLVEKNYLRSLKVLEQNQIFTLPFFMNRKGGIFFEDKDRKSTRLNSSH